MAVKNETNGRVSIVVKIGTLVVEAELLLKRNKNEKREN